ncbi:MAG: hypothetical protein GX638_11690 [Crenarchaeota archaeon]|nr:hypothetical protein [Thermoproteota archaeon]
MIKNIIYVEDGSVDLDELESTLTTETKIIVYRQGSTLPRLVQLQVPINDTFSEEEFKAQKKLEELRKETEELICKLLKEKCLTTRARKLIYKFGIDYIAEEK